MINTQLFSQRTLARALRLAVVSFLILLGIASNQQSMAQSDVIRGVVVDEENRPLPGANIVISSLNTGVITDLDGVFNT